jgi:hypothetical protein
VLVLLAVQYSNLAQWYASYCEPPRSTIDIASIQTAIEYEYRFTEYRFTEYELDKIRCEARTATWVNCIGTPVMGIENWGAVHIGPVPCASKESLEVSITNDSFKRTSTR